MVPVVSIIFMFVTLMICCVFPFITASIFKRKGFSTWGVFFIGMLGFFILQTIIRIPILQVISQIPWYLKMAESTLLLSAFLGLTAGLFETFGRFMVFKWILKKRRSYGDGLMAGLGHGTIEAVLLTGATYIYNLIYSFMINLNLQDVLLNSQPSASSAQAAVEAGINSLIATPPYNFLLGGVERIIAILFHIAVSILVLEGIRKKQAFKYCLVAVLFHALLDTIAAFMVLNQVQMIYIELVALAFALISLGYIIIAKKRFPDIPEPETLSES